MDKKNRAIAVIFAGLAIERFTDMLKEQIPNFNFTLRDKSGSRIGINEFVLHLAENNISQIEEMLEDTDKGD